MFKRFFDFSAAAFGLLVLALLIRRKLGSQCFFSSCATQKEYMHMDANDTPNTKGSWA